MVIAVASSPLFLGKFFIEQFKFVGSDLAVFKN